MKKMSRLKYELAIFVLISMGVSLFLGMLSSSMLRNDSKSDKEVYDYVYKDYIENLVSDLKNFSNDEEKMKDVIDKGWKLNYTVYLVDKEGKVLESSNDTIKYINTQYIKDGFTLIRDANNKVRNKDTKDTTVKVKGCYNIKGDYYLVFDYLGYGQNDDNFFRVIISVLIIFFLSFATLTGGRFTYLLKINKSIQIISKGNLDHKVPIKYKNELTQLARDINFMAEELLREDEKRKEFLTNISHDLRTPLTTIMGYFKIIKERRYDDDEDIYKYLDIMQRKSIYLKGMLDDFFEYSKLSSNDISCNMENICLQELVRQTVSEEIAVFKENDLELSLSLVGEEINVSGDGELIFRAISNILSNALKYSKKGTTVESTVSKEIREDKSYGVVTLSNVPKERVKEEEVNRFFDRLYKYDKSRGQEGSGLGLSIVKEIIKLHGGEAVVKKEEDRIVFTLLIPIYK